MSRSRRVSLFLIPILLVIIVAFFGWRAWQSMNRPIHVVDDEAELFVRPDTPADSVVSHLASVVEGGDVSGYHLYRRLQHLRGGDLSIRPGHYVVRTGDSMRALALRLSTGAQTPVRVVVSDGRSLTRLAARLADQLMADSAAFMAVLPPEPEAFVLLVPNTYELWWTVTPEQFLERMRREHDAYWNDDRKARATALGLTPAEVVTLASIVDEEAARADEKPIVAGLYLNRLSRGMLLQADPTVKYAVGDPTLRRILNVHLSTPSPYNTYLNAGLPPAPIRLPSRQAVEAVLNPAHHNYLYMCAREDFSGYHNFATNLSAHNANAARYHAALNARGVK